MEEANDNESLSHWAARNGIDLGDFHPYVCGYWCRVSRVPIEYEAPRRGWNENEINDARDGWAEADEEIASDIASVTTTNIE